MSDDFWKGLREARAEGIEQARLRAKFDIAAELAWRDQQIETLTETLRMIGEKAHEASTGPAEPDVYWDIRDIVYAAIGRLEKAMSLADDVSGMAEGKGLNPHSRGEGDAMTNEEVGGG